jgi:hypothetical protein
MPSMGFDGRRNGVPRHRGSALPWAGKMRTIRGGASARLIQRRSPMYAPSKSCRGRSNDERQILLRGNFLVCSH